MQWITPCNTSSSRCKTLENCHYLLWQARAHTLLRQKQAELGQARQAAADQFKADLSAAETAAAERQQQLQQVFVMLLFVAGCWCIMFCSTDLAATRQANPYSTLDPLYG